MKKMILTSLFLWIFCTIQAQNKYFELYTDSASLKNQSDEMIRDMEKMLQKVDPKFNFKGLTTEIPNTFMPGQFVVKTNKIYYVTWQIGGPPMGKFLSEMGGSKEKGEKIAALFFYGYFFPHEVGHAITYHTGNEPDNNYDSEYEANEIAVLYWRKKGKDQELQECYEFAKEILQKLENPVPPNEDPKKYITENYWQLVQDPYKYGYIQMSQIVKVMEDKSLPDFDTYIQKYFKSNSK